LVSSGIVVPEAVVVVGARVVVVEGPVVVVEGSVVVVASEGTDVVVPGGSVVDVSPVSAGLHAATKTVRATSPATTVVRRIEGLRVAANALEFYRSAVGSVRASGGDDPLQIGPRFDVPSPRVTMRTTNG
jgi:hypothetical protein